MNNLFHSILICLLSLLLVSCGRNQVETPKAVAGQLDVSTWDFQKKGEVPLAGEWHFWWKQLIVTKQCSSNKAMIWELTTLDVSS